jgi:HEAT repeat protein
MRRQRIVVLALGMVILAGNMWAQAAAAKNSIATPPNVNREIEKLSSTLASERVVAAINLGNIGVKAEAAIPFLIRALDDEEIVTMKSSPEGSPGLVAESSTTPRTQAARALAKIGKPAIGPLVAWIHDERQGSKGTKGHAFDALQRIGEPAVPALIELSKDQEYVVRLQVVDALCHSDLNSPEIMEALIDRLADVTSESIVVPGLARLALEKRVGRQEGLEFEGLYSLNADRAVRARYQENWRKWWAVNREKYFSRPNSAK